MFSLYAECLTSSLAVLFHLSNIFLSLTENATKNKDNTMKTHASSCSFIFALGENSNLASLYSFSQLRTEDESRSSSMKMCAAVHVRLYHLSARLIKLDSLFAVVVNAAAWSGEIIFLHALLTLFLFSPLPPARNFSLSGSFFFPLSFSFHKPPPCLSSSHLAVFLLLSFEICHSSLTLAVGSTHPLLIWPTHFRLSAIAHHSQAVLANSTT